MKQIEWEFKEQMDNNRDGSFATQQSRAETFKLIANESTEVGFRRITVDSFLKEKCISKYVDYWKSKGIAAGTIKNRMSCVRWSAKHRGVISRIPSNDKLGIANRKYITNKSKAVALEQKHLDKTPNQNIKDSLRVAAAFGARREESIKFNPSYADRGNKIVLKGSWCKGGRSREIPIRNESQRKLLDELKTRYGNNSLIPSHKTYKEQKDVYKNTVPKIGLDKSGHGIRHKYAQDRYKELTGRECPAQGGLRQKKMTKERQADKTARLIISAELGHGREQITSTYLGS